ncbi:dicarboxylate/amino acid:cation symporter [Pleionea sp. CnH1-48]|uniref:dicarboxylate/amino acid:cation symporter n=1 Tax=Pleionea sp. CnH1-48 TaxID=2954494 RepID=UPI002096AB49|nr:dicarboxylate/amino acid:cation symporter [Pleionea sp. CnH1-48]MCO7225411.1 dicarboxylate/amino acid:cation symporter [Pleionea sp. CnH1-48]
MLGWLKSESLSTQILIALGLGVALGLILKAPFLASFSGAIDTYIISFFDVIKTLFINSLKMMVVPLVLVSLICGVSALSDPSKLGRLGGKSLLLYLFTTAAAISMALLLANLVDPGSDVVAKATDYEPKAAPSIADVFSGLIASNPINAMANGNMLQVIVFALLFGFAMSRSGESGQYMGNFFNHLNEIILKLVSILMSIAPYGVFAIMVGVTYKLGFNVFKDLATYFSLVAITLIIHALVTYPTLLTFLARLNPLTFYKKLRPAALLAFSTASSAATLPVTMKVAQQRLGVGDSTRSFTLPLGATINMDGTAIMQGVATVFIAQMSGVDLTMSQYLTVILMATLASVGTAGVPGVGLIMLSMVLVQVDLPAEAIGMLLGVDRLLDMMRTAVNISGDSAVACIVSKSEGDFDEDMFNDPEAGLHLEAV